jgi:putative membrane protein
MSSEDRAVGAAERLHPLFLLTGLGGSLRGLAGGYALIGYLAVSGRAGTAILAASALLLFLVISVFLYWIRFEYRVGESEIRIDSGIVSRTHRSIPFDRVQDVDITQGPIARIAGLARVKFETGGAAGAGDDEGVLQAIPLARAEQLRTLIRARRSAAPQQDQAESGAEAPPIYAMGPRRLLLAGVFNFSLALFAGLFGATQSFGEVAGFDPFSRTFWIGLLAAGDPIAEYILEHRVVAAVGGLLVLIVAGALTGIVRTVLREFGFRLDRTEAGLRRRRGLLTRTDVTLRLKRAQAAIVTTGPVREGLGWCDLRLQSLASDEGGSGDHVVAPLATEEEVDRILSQIGWSLPRPVPWTRVSRAYVWSFVLGLSPLILLLGLQVAVIGSASVLPETNLRAAVPGDLGRLLIPTLVALAVIGAAVLVRLLAWQRTGFALDGSTLLVRSGWWRRRTLLLPVTRIQSIDINESFISRWFGTASLTFGVAGGGGFAGHAIPSLPRETASALRQQLLASAA